ncbi:hypothetical protein CgunFtcFv8_008136 [Champsocephalus gunnari]|uniref:ribonuclease H n=1 Tax=Champsocephalus gunnari TaxID=52237 RepID=A0AAN8D4Z5_CHAGU|nr:hypothetical protein CgunFtcFv8_008136 [Champsocephalus gunnari]
MLTHTSLLRLVRQNDWFTSVDLKDAYFHIPVYYPHRKYLRFTFQGICYEYRVLPFGLSLSPRVFVRCTEAAIAPLRHQGIRLATYLDDWLLLAQSEQEAVTQTNVLVKHLLNLGFHNKYREEHVVPRADCTLPGFTPELGALYSSPVSGKSESFQSLSRFIPAAQTCSLQIMLAICWGSWRQPSWSYDWGAYT